MPPSPIEPAATPSLRRGGLGRVVWRAVVALVMASWSLLLLAWLVLHWVILPHVGEWRSQIEGYASDAIGIPVRIGAIRVRSSGWVPALELDQVVLFDAQQREALRLPRVSAAVSARSLLAFELRFEQLLIEGAQLEVRRDAAGRLHVAGLDVSAPGEGESGLADWFFEQHEFVVLGGRLRWIDELRAAPPLELEAVDLVVRNGLRRHALRLDATPPPEWGDRFSLVGRFTQPLLSRAGQWRRWAGTLHADLPRADMALLRRHVDLPFELSSGDGALRAWIDVAYGELRGATADLALREVSLRLGDDLPPLVLEQVQGRLIAQSDEDRLRVALQHFGFVTGDGLVWPRGDLDLTLRRAREAPDAASAFRGGELGADRLDLAVMAGVAERLPLGAPVRRLLAELAPEGRLEGLAARWDGPVDAPLRYQAKARLEGLSIAAASTVPGADGHPQMGRPGWRNAGIDFNATERGGEATISLDRGALVFPGVLEQPELPLDAFSAQLAWRIERSAQAGQPPRIELAVRHARFANADAQGELEALWHTGAGAQEAHGAGARFPGVLELSGKLAEGRAAATARYLPLGLGDKTRRYVQDAVLGGRISGASFRVKGDLWDFPFNAAGKGRPAGEFRVVGRVEDVSLAYVPPEPGADSGWPAATGVAGELVFDRSSMEIREASGRIQGVDLAHVNGGIRSLADKPVLRIEGQGRGALGDMLRYVNATPVSGWIGGALSRASASGPAELRLALEIPVEQPERSSARGSVTLPGNDLRLGPDVPMLMAARGRVNFTENGLQVVGGAARLLGGEASFEGGTQPDGALRFAGQGVMSADGLRRATELGRLARLGSLASGQTAYRINLGFVRGQTELLLTSPLTGLALDLPAPLRKSAEAALPLRIQTSLLPEGPAAAGRPAVRDVLRLDLGNLVQARFERDLSRDAPAVLRGGIAVQDTLPQSDGGVAASLNVEALDADAWRSVFERLRGPAAAGASSPSTAPAAPRSAGAPAPGAGDLADASYLPTRIALRAQSLLAGSRRLSKVVAGISRGADDSTWRATLDADQLGGYVEWRPPGGAGNPGRVHARLARLSLPPAEAESVTDLLDRAPASVPALDIVVEDFELRGKKLGRVEIEAFNRGVGEGAREAQREWRLNRFVMSNPEAVFTATGQWAGPLAARRRMQLDFRLELADSGALLDRLGLGGTLRGGKGRLQGQVSWAGSPLSLNVPSMDGQMNLSLDKGQFLKAGPGVGRLLGVLSLQSLPRRLALDFRDVFQEGFAFDNVTGDVSVKDGVASTNNLRMRGVQAAVLMEGQADIERETQDLRVLVVPDINAGTASLAYAAINPALGLGTFLAQMFLRKPLMAASTREFHVSGTWADPKVERVERKIGEPLPDLDPPPATPPASAPPPAALPPAAATPAAPPASVPRSTP